MTKTPLVIWGASGHAAVVANIASLCGLWEVVGFIDDVNCDRMAGTFAGKPFLGGEEALASLKQKGIRHIALGFGHCSMRVKKSESLKNDGFELVTLIHPDAVISDSAIIGEGTVVGAGVIVDPGCKIGRYTILNNSAVICHGSTIDDGVHVCPGVRIGGDVHVGACCWIGIGSCVVERLRIGAQSYIGAGSIVTKDIPPGVLAYGNPARVIRSLTEAF
jgi:sugar O-acyltransferase (sialic acid O-acetyltransferase NeuD family)